MSIKEEKILTLKKGLTRNAKIMEITNKVMTQTPEPVTGLFRAG